MWTTIAVILSCAVALTAYDIARTSYCSSCSKPFAVFWAKGRLPVSRRVCLRCLKTHRALKRSHAR